MEEGQWEASSCTLTAKCDRCGEVRPLRLVVDPFVTAGIISPENDPGEEWWCYPCFERRSDEV